MKLCILLTTIFALVGSSWNPLLAQKHNSGDPLNIPLQLDDGQLILNFRYCPEGTVPLVPPWQDQESAGNYYSNGFYVLETELSIGSIAKILGSDALTRHKKILQDFEKSGGTEDPTYPNLADGLANESDSVPAIFISIKELVNLCEILSVLSTAQNLEQNTIEGRSFRLLTTSEWRKAAIGNLPEGGTYNNILFYNYPTPNELRDVVGSRFEDIFKELKTAGEFRGSIADIYTAFASVSTLSLEARQWANESLRLLFHETMIRRNTKADKFENARDDSTMKLRYSEPNNIGLYDLLNGLPEWTLAANTETEAIVTWDDLKKAMLRDKPSATGIQGGLVITGGSSFKPVTHKTVDDYWMTSTLWGGPKIEQGRLKNYTFEQFDETANDQFVGIRIGLFRSVRPNWFNVVRKTQSTDFQDRMEIKKPFDGFLKTLSELSSSEKQEAELNSVIAYYRALSLYKVNQLEFANESLAKIEFPKVKMPPQKITADDLAALMDLGGRPKKDNKETVAYVSSTPAGENALFVETLRELTKLDSELLK
jgi:hypothetical protein